MRCVSSGNYTFLFSTNLLKLSRLRLSSFNYLAAQLVALVAFVALLWYDTISTRSANEKGLVAGGAGWKQFRLNGK